MWVTSFGLLINRFPFLIAKTSKRTNETASLGDYIATKTPPIVYHNTYNKLICILSCEKMYMYVGTCIVVFDDNNCIRHLLGVPVGTW